MKQFLSKRLPLILMGLSATANSRKISCDYYIDDRMLLPESAKA
jgi:hypothetical protein